MTFDEIQSIWNSQQPVFPAVDRAELTHWLRARTRWFNQITSIVEWVMILTLLFLAAMFMKDPLLEGHDRILLVAAAACLLAAAAVGYCRWLRKSREVNFQDSLMGIVQKSLDRVEYQVRYLTRFTWWFSGAGGLGLAIGLLIIADEKRYLLWGIFIPAFVLCTTLTHWQIRREVRLNLAPEQARLERLLQHLRGESDRAMDASQSQVGE